MTSLNTYFDAFKPFAKSIQEKAVKLSEVVDEKFKKTQENLEKKRTKVIEASESEALPHLWRSSNENPLGEIVVIPPPILITPSSASALSESPRETAEDPPSRTVERKKHRRQRRLYDLENDSERKDPIHPSYTIDLIDDRLDQEEIGKCLDELIDTIISSEELPEQISINTLSTEENPIEIIITNEENPTEIILTNEENPTEIIITNEENSDVSETQSNIIETDFTDSINRSDTALENMELSENNFIIQPIEEEKNESDQIPISYHLTIPELREDLFMNSLPITSKTIDTSIVELPSVPIKKEKRFSLVHSYSLPPDVIISHMTCSSTYIYICTNKHSLYYTKVPENDVYYSLNWYTYTLPAERVIVSHTNETIWRIFEKSIYSCTDTIRLTPLGINWKELKFHKGDNLLSISINDQYGWFIKEDGTLWLIRISDDDEQQPMDVSCPFHLKHVVCSIDKIGVTTSDEQILIRVGCTEDCPEGGGWIFIEHKFGPFDDFALVTNHTMLCIIDKKHRVWIHDWSLNGKFYEILRNDEFTLKPTTSRYFLNVNDKFLCFTDCHEQLLLFSNCLTGVHWSLVQKGTRLQRLTGALPNENHVWALTTDGLITSSTGQILDKPRQAQYLTHASFVPQPDSENILWTLDESCNIYTRSNLNGNTQWEQLDQSQFDWHRRLVDIVCNNVGVWAVDDQGDIHFRHGHVSSSNEFSLLNPAWIPIPGEPISHRSFAQIFCGPKNWMVYATDNKQAVYARIGIDESSHVGTSWKVIEDCSALGLAISEHALWLLTSHGRIQCRENISLTNPIGRRTTTLPGRFNSIAVSTDDEQVWALYPPHHLFKLDRLAVLFEK